MGVRRGCEGGGGGRRMEEGWDRREEGRWEVGGRDGP